MTCIRICKYCITSNTAQKNICCFSNYVSLNRHAIKEILSDPAVLSRIQNTHAIDETRDLDRFFEMLDAQPDRAFYGLKHVLLANANNAIEVLLITDELFRYILVHFIWFKTRVTGQCE